MDAALANVQLRPLGAQDPLDEVDEVPLPPRHAAVGCGHALEVGQDAVPAWAVEPAPDARENAPEPDDRDIDEGRLAEGVVHPGRVLTWTPRLQRRP